MVLTLPLLAVLALQSGNPDFYTLGHDQAQFARKLKDAGYADLAENFCAQAEKNTALSEKDAATLRSVHLDLQIDLAIRLKDALEKKDKLKELLKAKIDFIDAYPGSPEAKDAEQNLPEVYRQLGEAYANALQKSEDPAIIRELRTEGAEVFSRGEGALSSRIETLNELSKSPSLSDAEVEANTEQLATAIYNLGRTYYYHASLLGSGDVAGEKLYELCITTYADFGLNYSDSLLNYSGLIYTGLAHKALGQNDDALQAFDDCIALTDGWEPDAQGKSKVPEEGADIISSAVLQKINLLTELKRPEDARTAADAFFTVIRNPEKTEQGLPLLAARMTAELGAGDSAAALKSAKLLVEADPRGPFGAKGREVLGTQATAGGSSSLGVKDTLRLAESWAAKKDYERAVTLCHGAATAARAGNADAEQLADVFALQAACLSALQRYDEAALSYDVAVETAPASKQAPENLNSAIDLYTLLGKKTRKDFYEKRADERIQQLATKYPKSQYASRVQLSQGTKLEKAEKYAEAADFYQGIAPDAASYPDAQMSAGTCLYQETLRLVKAKDKTARDVSVKAEAQLRKAQTVLLAAAEKTLDTDQAGKLKRSASQARSTLGELLMIQGLGREGDALAVAQENEASAGTDADKLGEARSLRVRALTATGKIKEARDFLEALITKDPGSKATASAAGVLARNLDTEAAKAFQAKPKSADGEELWKQAFRYYVLSVEPKLNEASAAREIEAVASRLWVMGLYFNNVPDRLSSAVGWLDRKVVAPEYWEKAAEYYETSLRNQPSLTARVALARTYGLLDRFADALPLYAKVIEDESFIDPSTNLPNPGALAANPELMNVYLELGDAQYEAAKKTNDMNGLLDSSVVFDRIVRKAAKTSEIWWQARYLQAASWMEQGEYKKARLSLRDLQRNTSEDFDEGKFGLNKLFRKMLTAAESKVVDEGGK